MFQRFATGLVALFAVSYLLTGCTGGDGQGSENTNENRTGLVTDRTPINAYPSLGRVHMMATEGDGSFSSGRTTSPYAEGIPGTDYEVDHPGANY